MLSARRLLTYDQQGGGNPQPADGGVDNHENILPIGYLERLFPINFQLVGGSIPLQRRVLTGLPCEVEKLFHIEIYLVVRSSPLTLEVN